jgi:hypothetical protein
MLPAAGGHPPPGHFGGSLHAAFEGGLEIDFDFDLTL